MRPPGPLRGDGNGPGRGPRALRGLFGSPLSRRSGQRMFDSGALRLVVLGLIAEEPRHGYDIIRQLKTRFQGSYSPSPGSIYPILQQLAEAGFVTSLSHPPRRRFAVTEAGRAWLSEQRAELEAINAQLEEAAAPIGEQAVGEAMPSAARCSPRCARAGWTRGRPAGCASCSSGRDARSRTFDVYTPGGRHLLEPPLRSAPPGAMGRRLRISRERRRWAHTNRRSTSRWRSNTG